MQPLTPLPRVLLALAGVGLILPPSAVPAGIWLNGAGGALLAALYAAEFPERVAKLVAKSAGAM